MPNEYPKGTLVDSPTTLAHDALLEDLRNSSVPFDTGTEVRADHGRDWWPLTIPDVARGHVPRWPGVVVRPTSKEDVSRTLTIASKHHVAVTAQGGRSSVVGG